MSELPALPPLFAVSVPPLPTEVVKAKPVAVPPGMVWMPPLLTKVFDTVVPQ